MKYSGKLYGKSGRSYIPLVLTSDEVDVMERERDEANERHSNLHELATRLIQAKGRHHTQLAFEALSEHLSEPIICA